MGQDPLIYIQSVSFIIKVVKYGHCEHNKGNLGGFVPANCCTVPSF